MSFNFLWNLIKTYEMTDNLKEEVEEVDQKVVEGSIENIILNIPSKNNSKLKQTRSKKQSRLKKKKKLARERRRQKEIIATDYTDSSVNTTDENSFETESFCNCNLEKHPTRQRATRRRKNLKMSDIHIPMNTKNKRTVLSTSECVETEKLRSKKQKEKQKKQSAKKQRRDQDKIITIHSKNSKTLVDTGGKYSEICYCTCGDEQRVTPTKRTMRRKRKN